jgi:hypothetical protein
MALLRFVAVAAMLLIPTALRAWDKTIAFPNDVTTMEGDQTKDLALVFSGGGVRATVGTAVALKAMRDFQAAAPSRPNIIARSKYALGLSGATWGLTPWYLRAGNIDEVFTNYDGRNGFGEFTHFSLTCDAPKKPRCHDQWVQDIQEHFIAPFFQGRDAATVPMSQLHARIGTGMPLPIFTVDRYVRIKSNLPVTQGKLYDSITHTNNCAVTTKLFCDNGLVLDFDKLERKKPQGPLYLSDWLGFSSSAWAETLDKRPVKIAIKDGTDEESEIVRFADAGATCNLPLMPLVWMHSSVKVIILFDFSQYDYPKYRKDGSEHPFSEMERCMQYWQWQDHGMAGYAAKRYCATDTDHWAFTTTNCTAPGEAVLTVLTKQGRPTLIHVPFLGNSRVQKLIKDFPTMAGASPKSYTKAEYDKLKAELSGFYLAVLSPLSDEIRALAPR